MELTDHVYYSTALALIFFIFLSFLQFRYEILRCLIKSNFRYCKKTGETQVNGACISSGSGGCGSVVCNRKMKFRKHLCRCFLGTQIKAEDLAELWV